MLTSSSSKMRRPVSAPKAVETMRLLIWWVWEQSRNKTFQTPYTGIKIPPETFTALGQCKFVTKISTILMFLANLVWWSVISKGGEISHYNKLCVMEGGGGGRKGVLPISFVLSSSSLKAPITAFLLWNVNDVQHWKLLCRHAESHVRVR